MVDNQSQEKRGKGSGRKRAPEGYYLAQEAWEKLGMNRDQFYRNIGDRGLHIQRYIPHGAKREGYYSKQEIEFLATLRKSGLVEHSKLSHVTFRAATIEDISGIIEIFRSLGGWDRSQPGIEQRASWYASNPEVDHVVLKGSIVMGMISGVPYTDEVMQKRLYGQIDAKDIKGEDILPFEDGQTYDIFVGLVERKKPHVEENEPKPYARYGARLVLGFRKFITEDLPKRGIRIRLMLAHSAEEDGQAFADALGFVHQGEGKYPIYILDMEHSDKEWVKRYRELWE